MVQFFSSVVWLAALVAAPEESIFCLVLAPEQWLAKHGRAGREGSNLSALGMFCSQTAKVGIIGSQYFQLLPSQSPLPPR